MTVLLQPSLIVITSEARELLSFPERRWYLASLLMLDHGAVSWLRHKLQVPQRLKAGSG